MSQPVFCHQCPRSKYVDTASPHFHQRFLSGERIALFCQEHHVNLHIHTHCPKHCSPPPEAA